MSYTPLPASMLPATRLIVHPGGSPRVWRDRWRPVLATVARFARVETAEPRREDEARDGNAPCLVLGVGEAAPAALRRSLREPSVVRLVVADCGAAPGSADGTPQAAPVTALSSAPVGAERTGALASWRGVGGAGSGLRLLPGPGEPDGWFVAVALQHLHEAGLVSGPEGRADLVTRGPDAAGAPGPPR